MELTKEQTNELAKLNSLYRTFELKSEASTVGGEDVLHEYMMEEFTLVNPDKEQLQRLLDERRSILGKKTVTKKETMPVPGFPQKLD